MDPFGGFLNRALSFENAFSIGLKSGLYGGRYSSFAPRFRSFREPLALVAGEIVHKTTSSGAARAADLLDVSLERKAVDGPVDDKGLGSRAPSERR